MKTQKLTIIRGLPGAGKTTFAKELAHYTCAVLIEPDALLTDLLGEYHYSPSAFEAAKAKALEMVRECARLGRDAVYADVLPTRRDVEGIATAWRISCDSEARCVVHVAWIPCTAQESMARNVHNVEAKDIIRTEREWECWPTEEILEVRR